MLTQAGIDIGQPTRAEMDVAAAWAEHEGWNLGRNDAEVYYRYGTDGYLVARIAGRPAGFIFALSFPGGNATCGVYIVERSRRGGRIGYVLGRAALHRYRDWNVSGAAVENKVQAYTAFGLQPAYRLTRYRGVTAGGVPAAGAAALVPAAEVPLAEIAACDRQCYPDDRTRLLSLWLAQPGAVALAAVSRGAVAGYGVVRPAQQGYRIEPLYAGSAAVATQLLQGLLARLPAGKPYFIDVPDNNPAARDMAQAQAWQPVFTLVRVYSKTIPAFDRGRIFGEFL